MLIVFSNILTILTTFIYLVAINTELLLFSLYYYLNFRKICFYLPINDPKYWRLYNTRLII